ncbi:MAG TPA: phytanoyl-CoA dioxygenase family protein [Chitinophagaceae bacterium]|nr:phytanoyl-CoA dioxygenase family protein [Chitinophagaceae bacterium]
MQLTHQQLTDYRENGFLLIENVFTEDELRIILHEMKAVIKEDSPRKILEKNGAVRSFFAPDFTNELFEKLTRLNRLVTPSRQLIGEDVYIHQTKINCKHAMVGDWWEWHQDYTFWKQDDGMPEPEVLTAMIFLNDANEFNGPMLLIPGSHKAGVVDSEENKPAGHADANSEWFSDYQNSTTYMSALTADLKYTLKRKTIADWARRKGIVAAKGKAGSVLFFHGNVFHASSNNMSPWERYTFLVTYNSIKNTLPDMPNPRPEFIANRNFNAVTAAADSAILECMSVDKLVSAVG